MVDGSRRRFLRNSTGWLAAAAYAPNLARAAADLAPLPPRDMFEHRILGKTGISVSVLGFGAAEIGYGRTDQPIVDKLLNSALDSGLDAIDTAECYAISEEQIGKAVSHRRKDFVLFTKVGHWPEDGWSKGGIEKSIERSLERLKTDHVDVIHLHSCGKEILEKGEAIEALEAAKKAGKTRFIGYSGDSLAARYALETDRFDTLMTSLSIADQEGIDLLLPLAVEKQVGVIVKRGIANAAWRYDELPENGYHREYWKRLQELKYDFCQGDRRDDKGPDGAASIALRFSLSLPGVHTNIVGTTKPERFLENRALLKAGPLDEKTFAAIRKRWAEVAKPEWVGQT